MKVLLVVSMMSTLSAYAVTMDNPYDVDAVSVYREGDDGLEHVVDLQDSIKSRVVRSQTKQPYKEINKNYPGINTGGESDPVKEIGQVLAIGDKLIAMGEKIYNLVNKGRPTSEYDYAPISIIPKSSKDKAIDVLSEMTGASMPKVENYHIIAKNGFNKTVVDFEFTLMFFHGLKYQGAGSYITAAQIIPKNVSIGWGYDFSAVMKLNGIANHGSAENPVAGGILVLEYNVKTFAKNTKKSAIFHIMGNGHVVNY